MQTHTFNLFADYFQFYLQDESAAGDLSDYWTEEAVDRLLAVAPGTIGVGTVRNMTVPVMVQVGRSMDVDLLDAWDHITESSIEIPAGRLVVAGCTDYFPTAARIEVEPGCYRARIFYGDLDTLSDESLEGNDHYKVVLWPGSPCQTQVIKKWPGPKARYQNVDRSDFS